MAIRLISIFRKNPCFDKCLFINDAKHFHCSNFKFQSTWVKHRHCNVLKPNLKTFNILSNGVRTTFEHRSIRLINIAGEENLKIVRKRGDEQRYNEQDLNKKRSPIAYLFVVRVFLNLYCKKQLLYFKNIFLDITNCNILSWNLANLSS